MSFLEYGDLFPPYNLDGDLMQRLTDASKISSAPRNVLRTLNALQTSEMATPDAYREELQRLVVDACEALKASVVILTDESLSIESRITAHERCRNAHRRICNHITAASSVVIAELDISRAF